MAVTSFCFVGLSFFFAVGCVPEGLLFRQVIPSTKCRTLRAAALSTLHWARARLLWTPGTGLPLAARAGAAALHLAQRACHPLDYRQHKRVMLVLGMTPLLDGLVLIEWPLVSPDVVRAPAGTNWVRLRTTG